MSPSDDQAGQAIDAEQQASAAAQAQAMAAAEQGVNMAKTASDIDTGGENPVGEMMRNAGLA